MIIALSGKKRSGKDTVCKIIQYLVAQNNGVNLAPFEECLKIWELEEKSNPNCGTNWKRKMFAGKLKEMVCLLLGCTMEQLEDNDFKEKELGEEWWYYNFYDSGNQPYPMMIAYNKDTGSTIVKHSELIKLTPRKLLQLLGTECGRSIHLNIWVNALMSDYKEDAGYKYDIRLGDVDITGSAEATVLSDPEQFNNGYPNWIITDCRFPNEAKAVKDREGLIIRIERPLNITSDRIMATAHALYAERMINHPDLHESETALDNYDGFECTIINNGTIGELVEKVKGVLQMLNIIK